MIICIVGPTAVGKTKLSIELAKKYKAIVVNCDSTQVYKGMNVGTAKVTEEEKEGIPHYLFDIVDPDYNYTVYDYQQDARKIIEENKGRNIILVGGTGLYLKAGLYDYEFEERENSLEFEQFTNEELLKMLEQKGMAEGVHVNNRRRLISRLNSSGNNNRKDILLYD
ncbi:MAG: tRNA (adenosine(37)-N6)-dimethylallyltransferase MiaA, partial [Bacilli bacterium]|nr:tRNA (adenosine(37)-N6)-dimethylallyltransferase MiaA [Bacilli bacterium]